MILVSGESQQIQFNQVAETLAQPNTEIRLFGKHQVNGTRRMGVIPITLINHPNLTSL